MKKKIVREKEESFLDKAICQNCKYYSNGMCLDRNEKTFPNDSCANFTESPDYMYKEEQNNLKKSFKKLHYATEHLPFFHEFSTLTGLNGRHYLPILKARYYQLLGGIIQRNIVMGNVSTDTRFHIAYPLVTEGGKNELIYAIKSLIKIGIQKDEENTFSLSTPTSFHPEQLIGKYIEVTSEVRNESTGRMKKIKNRVENRGHLNNDFLDFDECTSLITSTSREETEAREILSISENEIGKNEVVKRLVDDTPENTLSYCPKSTHSYYFQPYKKIPEEAFLQGFLRRKLIPIGSIEHFLNFADENLYSQKINKEYPRENYIGSLISYLNKIRRFVNKDFDVVFDEESRKLILDCALYIQSQGKIHSEKISNFVKLTKYTILSNLVKMSAILSFSYGKQIVDKNLVHLAYMDLVELMQNTFDFIYERTWGDFDYGTTYKGADFKQKQALEILFKQEAFSKETSDVTIDNFVKLLMDIYKVAESQARNKYLKMKDLGLIDSAQVGQNSSSVWLNFIPNIDKMEVQGTKGSKGYNLYNHVFHARNTILRTLKPLKPLKPSG